LCAVFLRVGFSPALFVACGAAPRARVGDGLGAHGRAADGESDAACAAQAEAIRVLGKRVLIDMTFDRYGHLFPSAESDREAMAQLQARLVG
jgi:hypothetical protein